MIKKLGDLSWRVLPGVLKQNVREKYPSVAWEYNIKAVKKLENFFQKRYRYLPELNQPIEKYTTKYLKNKLKNSTKTQSKKKLALSEDNELSKMLFKYIVNFFGTEWFFGKMKISEINEFTVYKGKQVNLYNSNRNNTNNGNNPNNHRINREWKITRIKEIYNKRNGERQREAVNNFLNEVFTYKFNLKWLLDNMTREEIIEFYNSYMNYNNNNNMNTIVEKRELPDSFKFIYFT